MATVHDRTACSRHVSFSIFCQTCDRAGGGGTPAKMFPKHLGEGLIYKVRYVGKICICRSIEYVCTKSRIASTHSK
jgi:hypothetical protein